MTLFVFPTTVSAHAEQGTGSFTALPVNADRTVATESSSTSGEQPMPPTASNTMDTVPTFVTNGLVMT
jgi:hypothetical protein